MTSTRPFDLTSPLMNAAGSLGFSPDIRDPRVNLQKFGAFVTNPITYGPHTPARKRAMLTYPGGFFLHTGLPNAGLRTVLKKYGSKWANSDLTIVPHLIAKSPEEMEKMVLMIEEQGLATAVEIGIHASADVGFVRDMITAALGELAIVVRLPLNRATDLAEPAHEAGASALSLGPPRGVMPDEQGELLAGRLYGPGLFPQSLAAVKAIVAMEIPVIGGAGVYDDAQVALMLKAGAMGVQMGSALWKGSH